jgi:endonuclease I
MKYYFLLFALAVGITNAQAQEPATQPTNFTTNSVTQYSVAVSFTGNASAGYLVIKGTSPISFVPVDGTTYEKGEGVGNSEKVISSGNVTSLNVREIRENTTYHFAVFAYNGSGGSRNYKQSNPLTGTVTTPADDPGAYYNGLDSMGPNFINQLHSLINPHTFATYTSYRTTVIPVLYERDTVGGQAVVNCDYSGETTVYTPPFNFVDLNYSREHTICQSWMKTHPTFGSNITSQPEGADFFNLLLARLDPVNTVRSNWPYGEVVTPTSVYLDGMLGKDANNNTVYEPRDEIKGDAARCQMYEMVCYNGTDGSWALDNLLSNGPDQDESIIRAWHLQDPPSKVEHTRNAYIFTIQDNRNPFIDHPGWVDCIDFNTLNKRAQCINVSVNSVGTDMLNATVYPNPSNGNITLQIGLDKESETTVVIYDLTGRQVMSINTMLNTGLNNVQLSTDNLPAGNYILSAQTNSGRYTAKLVRF